MPKNEPARKLDRATAEAALPKKGFVAEFIRYASFITDAPRVFHFGVGQATLAAALPASVSMFYAGNLNPALWVLVIGESGVVRKSSSTRIGAQIIERAFKGITMRDPQSEMQLVKELDKDPQRFMHYSEFGAFLKGSKQGSHKEALRTKMMEIWDGGPVSYQSSKLSVTVDRPLLSMVGGIADDLLAENTASEDWKGGYMNRHCLLISEQTEKPREPPTFDPWEAQEDYLVGELLRISSQSIGTCRGYEDIEFWRDWTEAIDAKYGPLLGGYKGFLTRARTLALKAAMGNACDYGYAMQAQGGDWVIDNESMAAGMRLAELNLHSAVYATQTFTVGKVAQEQQAVLTCIGAGARDLGYILRNARPKQNKRNTKQILETLVSAQLLYEYTTGTGTVFSAAEPPVTAATGAPINDVGCWGQADQGVIEASYDYDSDYGDA